MKLETLIKALEHYIPSAECSEDERKEALAALKSCQSVRERFASSDIWSDTIYVVTSDALSSLLNTATYDIYGKCARTGHGNNVKFEYYAHDCRRRGALEELTDEQLQLGYDIISDLWHDNEASGYNNEDGSFRR